MKKNRELMFPPPLDGDVVRGLIQSRELRLDCHPASPDGRLKSVPGFKSQELAMDTAREGKALPAPGYIE